MKRTRGAEETSVVFRTLFVLICKLTGDRTWRGGLQLLSKYQ